MFTQQVDFILKRGDGIKACLFDSDSKQIISSLIPLSTFQDAGFFYFDYLTNKNRTKVDGMSCVVILRPDSLKMLLEEIICPFYGNYIVLFTTQIDPFVLEIMANTDIHSVISEVHEINLDMTKQSSYFYTTGPGGPKRASDALSSLILTLGISPTVLMAGENMEDISREVSGRISQFNLTKKGTLVLLNRNLDLITPLLYDWHYFSMINEHFHIENSVIKMEGGNGLLNDSFFNNNKFRTITDVGEEINGLIKEMDKRSVCAGELEKIQEAISQKSMAEMHLGMYNKIVTEAVKRQTVSEAEYRILLGRETKIAEVIEGVADSNALRILLIYFLRFIKNWDEESKNFPKFRTDLLKFKEAHRPRDWQYKSGFDSSLDVKLGYISPLRRMLKHLIQGRLKEEALVGHSRSGEGCDPIVVYLSGGVSLMEYREVRMVAEECRMEIILVSDHIMKTSELIRSD